MKNSEGFRQAILEELATQTACGYQLWRSIPCSATRRALALLDLHSPDREKTQSLFRAAVEEGIDIAHASERGEQTPTKQAWLKWLEKSRQPWHFGVKLGEWHFKGFRERQELAKELSNLRKRIPNFVPSAKTLIDYYESVSNEELEKALEWKVVRGRQFFDALLNVPSQFQITRLRDLSRETHFRIHGFDSELELAASVRGGTLSYSIFGFFENPVASSCYEGHFGIGIGEWDLLEAETVSTAAITFAEILAKYLRWKRDANRTSQPRHSEDQRAKNE